MSLQMEHLADRPSSSSISGDLHLHRATWQAAIGLRHLSNALHHSKASTSRPSQPSHHRGPRSSHEARPDPDLGSEARIYAAARPCRGLVLLPLHPKKRQRPSAPLPRPYLADAGSSPSSCSALSPAPHRSRPRPPLSFLPPRFPPCLISLCLFLQSLHGLVSAPPSPECRQSPAPASLLADLGSPRRPASIQAGSRSSPILSAPPLAGV